MPVINGVLVPRTVLVEAEHVVDYLHHYAHVTDRRLAVENAGKLSVRLACLHIADLGLPGPHMQQQIADRLYTALRATARHGYTSARQEIRLLRDRTVRGEHALPDAGAFAEASAAGLDGVLAHARDRAYQTAVAILLAATRALNPDEDDPDLRRTAVLTAGARALHNHALELVGEVLNLGRSAGAMSLRNPPEFAMRSEQMDKQTCDACEKLHGEIVEIGSSSYYEYMPPSGCYGGGRCRGIYVFADGPQQVRGPETEPGPQPALNPVPPVEFPVRRAA